MSRAASSFALDLVEGGGILTLRDAEPYALATPTSIAGTIDAPDEETGDPGTGAITNGTFTTPRVSIFQDITSPVVARVYIDADFSHATPGNLTGTVDQEGNVFVQTALKVNLHIDVGRNPTILSADCVANPINLTLTSVEPYDPETEQVTLANGNFTIPEVASGGACESNVRSAINEQLAGAGHAITLTLEGDLPLPQAEKEPVETTFAVTPEGGAQAGDEVTLTASVQAAPDADAETAPTGFVTFRDGTQVIDSVPLQPDGTAELIATTLPAGVRTLTFRYGGDETYAPAISRAVDYTIWANPALTGDIPPHVQIAGPSVDFTVTTTNTGLGQNLENVRLDVSITRTQGTGPLGPTTTSQDRVVLARIDDEDVTPIPLASSAGTGPGTTLTGSIGAGTGIPLGPGATLEEALRLTVPSVGTPSPTACGATNATCPGPVGFTFALRLVDPETGDVVATLASETARTMFTEATRRVSAIAAGSTPPPPFPSTPAIVPQVVRAGNSIALNSLSIGPTIQGVSATGTLSFSIDGKPVGAIPNGAGASPGYQVDAPCCADASYVVPVPADTPSGVRTLTLRYGGDSLFQPAVANFTFTVVAQIAPVYECVRPALGTAWVGRANLIAQGGLPAVVRAGEEVAVDKPVLRLLVDRGASTNTGGPGGATLNVVFSTFTDLELDYSVGSQTLTTGIVRTNATRMDSTSGDPDQVWTFNGLATSLTIDGDPGEVLPITLEEIRINFASAGGSVTCTPVASPASLGSVTVAGTSLAVSPSGSVREGGEVVLDAVTAPVSVSGGVVEFRDGVMTLGVVPVDPQGRASMVTSGLPVGVRSLTARYLGGLAVPSTVSDPVVLEVVPTACEGFAEAGSAAVVRLVYLELLGRCPDQGGFDYWTGRLEGGTSAEAFARSIARTPEAVGRVVDDAYETMLGRPADPAGRAFWVGRLQASGRYDTLLADLGASGEFWSKAGATNEGFVTRVYDRLLGRVPDGGGLAHWTGRLDAGASRRALIVTLANLDEPLGRLVGLSYEEILDRVPSAGERASGIAHLRSTGDRSGLYAQLIGRPEFATRAGTFPNPED